MGRNPLDSKHYLGFFVARSQKNFTEDNPKETKILAIGHYCIRSWGSSSAGKRGEFLDPRCEYGGMGEESAEN